jgi:hypothetical protein
VYMLVTLQIEFLLEKGRKYSCSNYSKKAPNQTSSEKLFAVT